MVLQLIGRLLNISMIRGSIDYLNPTVMQHKQVYTHASTLYSVSVTLSESIHVFYF